MQEPPDPISRIVEAKSRIRQGPPPEWVTECPFSLGFRTGQEQQETHLLNDRQVHAEQRATYYHTAVRLETMEAVARQSQWRVNFDPRSHSVTLHHLKIRRGGTDIDHLDPQKGHLLQREEGLERLMIFGWFTFLIVLEDVRPGDVLDYAFTLESKPHICPENFFCEHHLPEWVSIGKYHFAVHFKQDRPMKWKSSEAQLSPTATGDGDLTIWNWTGEDYTGVQREAATPTWHVSAPWIQVSDCSSWSKIGAAVADAWAKQVSDVPLKEILEEVEQHSPDLSERVDKAIEIIQDRFRYLSISLTLGGIIPAPSDVVARRRYGDCKDLSLLLVTLLKQLGVKARPVLVSCRLRKSVSGMLPSPGAFDHVVAEFELEGQKRWVDPTIMRQGGGPYGRVIGNFGVGLSVDAESAGLAEPPQVPSQSHLYELQETILVDTAGVKSIVAQVTRAEGFQADRLRNEFQAIGVEQMSKKHQQDCANRFGWARRIGSLQFRDDRAANRFFVAEVFEIDRFLYQDASPGKFRMNIPSHWIESTLSKPPEGNRHSPFALPFPCHIVHIVEVQSRSLGLATVKSNDPVDHKSQYLEFCRTRKAGQGYWRLDLSVKILADSVSASNIQQHREVVNKVWASSKWALILPKGVSKPAEGRDFGKLPPPIPKSQSSADQIELKVDHISLAPAEKPSALTETIALAAGEGPAGANPVRFVPPIDPRFSGKRRRNFKKRAPLWLKVSIGIIVILFFLIIRAMVR